MSQSPFFSISLHDQRAVSNQTYQQKCKIQLDRHNQYRRKHHVPDLQLSSDLNKIAQAYADKLGPTNKIKHSGTKYKGQWMGENLYWSSPPSPAGKATDNWYN